MAVALLETTAPRVEVTMPMQKRVPWTPGGRRGAVRGRNIPKPRAHLAGDAPKMRPKLSMARAMNSATPVSSMADPRPKAATMARRTLAFTARNASPTVMHLVVTSTAVARSEDSTRVSQPTAVTLTMASTTTPERTRRK